MTLIVLHCNGNGHENTLDSDVQHMGNHYGNIIHVLQNQNANFVAPSPHDAVVHILAHGSKTQVVDLSAGTFKIWMVKAFQMKANPNLAQTFFIYSCDLALGGNNLLSSLALHVAAQQIKNRTFIGTAGENGVTNTGQGIGKVLVKKPGTTDLQGLGLGWKGYRTELTGGHVIARKLEGVKVTEIVQNAMAWG